MHNTIEFCASVFLYINDVREIHSSTDSILVATQYYHDKDSYQTTVIPILWTYTSCIKCICRNLRLKWFTK